MSAPDYSRQHGKFASMTKDARHAWFRRAADDAKSAGCEYLRAAVDDASCPTVGLVEGWKTRPEEVPGPQFHLTAEGKQ